MNPAHISARVVMPSQMFGIVEIHVGAGLGQVWGRFGTRPRSIFNTGEDAVVGEGHRSAMNPAHMNARGGCAQSDVFWHRCPERNPCRGRFGAGLEPAPDQFQYARTRRWRWDGRRSAMNPAYMNAWVVMPSQMFGIVEIHVGAGLGQVWGRFGAGLKPAPTNANTRGDAAAVGRA